MTQMVELKSSRLLYFEVQLHFTFKDEDGA